jgi:chromosome segregation ATPase
VGLVDERRIATTYEAVVEILERITRDDQIQSEEVMADGEDMLASLRTERQGLRNELERVNAEIRSTRTFTLETTGYEREAKEQRARLSAVGLIRPNGHSAAVCPVCESHLSTPVPTVAQIERSLRDLSQQLEVVEAENPRLQARLPSLLAEAATFQERLRDNQLRINTRMRENEILRVQQENFILQARAIGKITQYIETARTGEAGSKLRKQVEIARNRVAVLEAELDPEAVREKLNAFTILSGVT